MYPRGGISAIRADGDIDATATAYGDIGYVDSSHGDITGRYTSQTGRIKEIRADDGSIIGTVKADKEIGDAEDTDVNGVIAAVDVGGTITAGGYVELVSTGNGTMGATVVSRTAGIGAVTSGGDITGRITAKTDIGDVIAGGNIVNDLIAETGSISLLEAGVDNGGHIHGNVSAGRNIGAVIANESYYDEALFRIRQLDPFAEDTSSRISDTTLLPPPKPSKPVRLLEGVAGDIVGNITVGGTVGTITADGKIDGNLQAEAFTGTIRALGAISGDTDADLGNITMIAWGDVGGSVTAVGNIDIHAFGDISSALTSEYFNIAASTWGEILGNAEAGSEIDQWADGGISSSEITSRKGDVDIVTFGTLSGSVVNAFGDIDLYADSTTGIEEHAGGQIKNLVWTSFNVRTIENTMNSHVADTGDIFIACMGNLSLWGSLAGNRHVSVLAKNLDAPVGVVAEGLIHLGVRENIDGTFLSRQYKVTATGKNLSGIYQGKQVKINAYGHTDAEITADYYAEVRSHGDFSGKIEVTESQSLADLFTSGSINGTVHAKGAVMASAWGNINNTLTSQESSVTAFGFGDVDSGATIQAHTDVQAMVWGALSGSVKADEGIAQVFSDSVTMSGSVQAMNGVTLRTLGNLAGSVDTSGVATVTVFGGVTAEASIRGAGGVDVFSKGDIAGSLEAAAGTLSATTLRTFSGAAVAQQQVDLSAEILQDATITSDADGAFVGARDTITNSTFQAASWIQIFSGNDADLAATLTEEEGVISLMSMGGATISATAPSGSIDVTSGGDADLKVTGIHPESFRVDSGGGLKADGTATGGISLMSALPVGQTTVTSTEGSIDIFSEGNIDATASSGDRLVVTSLGSISGDYTSGEHTSATDRDGQLLAKGDIDAAITGRAFLDVSAGGNVNGTINADGSADVTARQAVGASVDVDGSATVTAVSGGVAGTIDAGQSAVVTARSDISGAVTTGANADVVSLANVFGNVYAGGIATVSAMDDVSGTVSANYDASVYGTNIVNTVTAGRDATVMALNTVTHGVSAGEEADVMVLGDLTGEVSGDAGAMVTTLGAVRAAVSSLQGAVEVTAKDSIEANLTAAATISLSTCADLADGVSATAGGNISARILRDLIGSMTASDGSVSALIVGNLDGTITARDTSSDPLHGNLSVTVLGDITGALTTDRGADLSTLGVFSGALTAGDAHVFAWGQITGDITAGNHIQLSAWGGIDNSTLEANTVGIAAGQTVLQLNVIATDRVDVATADSTDLTVGTDGDVSLTSFGSLTARLNAIGGSVDLFGHDSIDATVTAVEDISVLALGNLNGSLTSTGGNIDATSVGYFSAEVDAHAAATVSTLGEMQMVTISAGTLADVSSFGLMGNPTITAPDGVKLSTFEGGSAILSASEGKVTVMVGDATGTPILNISDSESAEIVAAGQVHLNLNLSGDIEVNASGTITGAATSTGGSINVVSADWVKAALDAALSITAVGYQGIITDYDAGYDIVLKSYGDITITGGSSVTAGNDIQSLWARGNITGVFTAGNDIHDVMAYGAINGTFTAGLTGTIDKIEAWRDIEGGVIAETLTLMRSGQSISADLANVVNLGDVIENDHYLFGRYPDDPNLKLARTFAQLAGARRAAAQMQQLLMRDKQGLAREWQAMYAQAAAQASQLLQSANAAVPQVRTALDQANSATEAAIADIEDDAEYLLEATELSGLGDIKVFTALSAHKALDRQANLAYAGNMLNYVDNCIDTAAVGADISTSVMQATSAKMLNALADKQQEEIAGYGDLWDKKVRNRLTAIENWNKDPLDELPIFAKSLNWLSSKPSLAGSMIPVVGSFRELLYNVVEGNWGMAALSFAFTVADVLSLGTAGTATKSFIKAGIKAPAKCNGVVARVLRSGCKGGKMRNLLATGKKAGRFVCFAEGTEVLVGFDENGGAITTAIEDVEVGDRVLARDQYEEDDDVQSQAVTQVFRRQSDHLRIVRYVDEAGTVEEIRTTDEHPFWVAGLGWTSAGDLQPGMTLGDLDGIDGCRLTVLSSTREAHPEGVTVYNFEVAADHTYFVEDGTGDAAWTWVHNQCRPLASSRGAVQQEVKFARSFSALKRRIGPAGEGKVWHHVVEQRATNVNWFGAEAIHNTQNVVSVSRQVNQNIANYYSSIRSSFTGNRTVRQWLGTQSWREQYEFGQRILKQALDGQPLP